MNGIASSRTCEKAVRAELKRAGYYRKTKKTLKRKWYNDPLLFGSILCFVIVGGSLVGISFSIPIWEAFRH